MVKKLSLEAELPEEKIQDVLERLAMKNKSFSVRTLDDVEDTFFRMDYSWFPFMQATKTLGLKQQAITEIIGGDGLGKTSLCFSIVGQLLERYSAYAFYIETERKKMNKERIERCLSTKPGRGKELMKRVSTAFCSDIPGMIDSLESWTEEMRTVVPKHIPLFVIVDSFSKLQNSRESEGRRGIQDLTEAEKKKLKKFAVVDATQRDKLDHAILAQAWCRHLPRFIEDYNVTILIVSHQNAKLDGFGGGSFAPDGGASQNRTKIGGNALNQNAALQIILSRTGYLTNNKKEKIGDRGKMTFIKNSYGPKGQDCVYDILGQFEYDTETSLEPVISFERSFSEWLTASQIVAVEDNGRGRLSIPELGLEKLPANMLSRACFNNPGFMADLCRKTGVNQADSLEDIYVVSTAPDTDDVVATTEDEPVKQKRTRRRKVENAESSVSDNAVHSEESESDS